MFACLDGISKLATGRGRNPKKEKPGIIPGLLVI
jgi:hypothetical protein